MCHTMVCGQECSVLVLSNGFIQEVEEITQVLIQPQKTIFGFYGIGSKTVADIIRGGKTDGQQVCKIINAQLLIYNRRFGKF